MKRTNTAVWLDKYNRWQIKVQKNGIRKTFYSSLPGRNGQRECNAKADAWLDDGITQFKCKVIQMSEKYMEQLKLTTSKSHWKQYQYYFDKWVIPSIGNVRMEDLTQNHLQSVINKAYSKGLAKKTLCNIRSCIMSFLKYCRADKATALFVEDLKVPKGAVTKEKVILQPIDLKILFLEDCTVDRGKIVKEIYINAFRFEVSTGLRPGEIAGLKRSDIKGRTVSLKRSINTLGEETKGKNENAQRTFYLTDFSLAILSEQYTMLKELGIESEYVFPDQYGEPIKQTNYYKHWIRYRKNAGIRTDVSPYELRHTFVSVVKSIPEGYLKQLVGHSKSMDTYGIYSHNVDGDLQNASILVNQIFTRLLG